jgi:hypothetical protein
VDVVVGVWVWFGGWGLSSRINETGVGQNV